MSTESFVFFKIIMAVCVREVNNEIGAKQVLQMFDFKKGTSTCRELRRMFDDAQKIKLPDTQSSFAVYFT